jgi:hypothetical protein
MNSKPINLLAGASPARTSRHETGRLLAQLAGAMPSLDG